MMGGELSFKSEPGKGSTFCFTVRLRLAVLLMVAATLLTGAIGAWIYQLAVSHLQHDREEFKTALIHELAQPMAGAMWNFDTAAAAALLDAKLGSMVRSITAIDARGRSGCSVAGWPRTMHRPPPTVGKSSAYPSRQ